MTQANNPLHGIKLEALLTDLVDHYGWEELGRRIDIRCFNHDPSIKSSLKFLRKTQWAREKVERLYLKMIGEPIPAHLRGDAGRPIDAPKPKRTTGDEAESSGTSGVNQHIWGKTDD
ncbi:VF530 family DNA-binding protein [Shewanella loihica]|nr:VF530 family protein [Shewanella loihica]